MQNLLGLPHCHLGYIFETDTEAGFRGFLQYYLTIPLLGYSSLIFEMSLCPFPQTPTDLSVRFSNNNSGLCGANLFAE